MPHLHLQIQFGSDFEGYASGSIPPACPPPPPPPLLTPSSFILASSYTWNIMQIFVKSECDYVGGEMSVGMFATPLTLSAAAALSWIPWLNFNRCSTMRIRQGDLAVLFHCAVRYACIMRMSGCMFGLFPHSLRAACWLNYVFRACVCKTHGSFSVFACCSCRLRACRLAGGRAIAFNTAACVFSLTQPKGKSCLEKSWKTRVEGPVVNLEHWFYINSWLATDSWPYKCRCKGKGLHPLPRAHTHTYIWGGFIMHTHHIEGSL